MQIQLMPMQTCDLIDISPKVSLWVTYHGELWKLIDLQRSGVRAKLQKDHPTNVPNATISEGFNPTWLLLFALKTDRKRKLPIHILRQMQTHIRRVHNLNITCNPWNYYSIHLPSILLINQSSSDGETPDFQPRGSAGPGAPWPESQESGAIVARFVLHLVVVDLRSVGHGGQWEDGPHTPCRKRTTR